MGRLSPAMPHVSGFARSVTANGHVPGYTRTRGGVFAPRALFEDRGAVGQRGRRGGGIDLSARSYRDLNQDPTRRRPDLTYGSADSDILLDLREARARAQELKRNNPIAATVLLALGAAVASGEFTPQPDPQVWHLPGITEADVLAFRDSATRAWMSWKRTPDVEGEMEWPTFVGLLVDSWLENGDVWLVRQYADDDVRPRKARGRAMGFRWQVVESPQVLDSPIGFGQAIPSGHTVAGGVERDLSGRPVALHIYRRHPGDLFTGAFSGALGAASAFETMRIPWRDEDGRRNVVGLFERNRVGQSRGVPALMPLIGAAEDVAEYMIAALTQAKVQALHAGYITQDPANGVGRSAAPETTGASEDGERLPLEAMRPGMLRRLAIGEEVVFNTTPSGGPNFEVYLERAFVMAAGAVGLSYELLTGDFRKTTYSSARAAFERAWMRVRGRMHPIVIGSVCRASYEHVIEEAAARGRLRLPAQAGGADPFGGAFEEWAHAKWIAPPMPRIDVEKEVKGDLLRLGATLTTRSAITAKDGGADWSTIPARLAEEERELRANGLQTAPPAPGGPSPDSSGAPQDAASAAEAEQTDGDPDAAERRQIDRSSDGGTGR
ncbi:MAG: phage portal protein [Phycisphaerae bacterium]